MSSRTDLHYLNCSMARALAEIGDNWSLLILRDALLGAKKFSQFRLRLGVAKNILSARLSSLCENGLLEKHISTGHPTYHITPKGASLGTALMAILQWGDVWLSNDTPPIKFTDIKGIPIEKVSVFNTAGKKLNPSEIIFHVGPGANQETAEFLNNLRAQKMNQA